MNRENKQDEKFHHYDQRFNFSNSNQFIEIIITTLKNDWNQ